MFIKSEADIIMQIIYDIKILLLTGFQIKIDHVKGHQDDNIAYCDLPRPAQLNVDADTYATNYLQEGSPIQYIELPANPISFYISHQVITRSHKNEIRTASRSPEFRIYMIRRLNWHDITPDLVWWAIHGSSIKSLHFNDRRRIRKFNFRWLPTCARLHKYDTDVSDKCPSCGVNVETHEHFVKCYCSSRQHLKNDWFVKVKTFLFNQLYVPEVMGHILYNMLLISCYTKTEPIPVLPVLPPIIQRAYNEQQRIGWDQLLCGRLTRTWGTLAANQLHTNQIPEKEMTALTWGRKFNGMVHDLVLNLCQQRNADGHLSTRHQDSQLARDRLMAQIIALQNSNPDISYQERIFIYRPLETLQAYSLANLQAWYRMAINVIQANRHRDPQRTTRRQQRSRPALSDPDPSNHGATTT